jgi:hypothetical protein
VDAAVLVASSTAATMEMRYEVFMAGTGSRRADEARTSADERLTTAC